MRWVQKGFLLLCLAMGTVAAEAAVPAAGDTVYYRLSREWSLPLSDDEAPYVLRDPAPRSIPPVLLGTWVTPVGRLYLVDEITGQLVALDPPGREVFRVGRAGEGPEEHRGSGDPLPWPGCAIARSDCVIGAKIIRYDGEGRFLDRVALQGQREYLRVLPLQDGGVGIGVTIEPGQASTMEIVATLVVFDADGEVRAEIQTGRNVLSFGTKALRHEEDMEVIPRVATDGDRRIYVQPDPYRWEIACYDPDLHLLWRRQRDVRPLPKTGAALAAAEAEATPVYAPSRRRHVIRRLVGRPGGELWVETDRRHDSPGVRVLERFNAGGEAVGSCRVTGRPQRAGRTAFCGDRVLWVRPADSEDLDGPFLEVYRLVPASPG